MAVDLVAGVPLLERDEIENGTLFTLAMFYGSTFDEYFERHRLTMLKSSRPCREFCMY
jgi:hypothetical protein